MKLQRNLIALSATILWLAASSTPAAQLPGKIYIVRPAINNYAILPGEPLPEVCQSGTTMKIMACRGEYEPASFVIKADSPLEAVRVSVGPLTSTGGTLPADAVDVRAVQVIFRRITDWPGLCPWLLVHDPGLFVVDDKPQPIALLPDAHPHWRAYTKTNRLTRAPVDTKELQPANIDDLRQFWITVHVPIDAAPGTYHARVDITAANAPAAELALEVTVPGFELLLPTFEYSVYYPVYLDRKSPPEDRKSYGDVTEQQYLAELKNMVAHGCTNPNIYGVHGERIKKADGSYDFTYLDRILRLREQAGMRSKALYLVDSHRDLQILSRKLTAEERASTIDYVQTVVTWAAERGYPDVYFYGNDEVSGEELRGQRDSFEAVHEGGGKLFAACGGFYELVGDLLDLPITLHPGHGPIDGIGHALPGPEALRHPETLVRAFRQRQMLSPGFQKMIDGVHGNGFRIFTYMDPVGGRALPEVHRRYRGLGLWKAGLDGTMTWAYTHIESQDPAQMAGYPAQQPLMFNLVFRARNSVIDTLGWEGFREGVDDARYLATLIDAIKQARNTGRHIHLAHRTQRWLDNLDMFDTDLDSMRREMARRTRQLLSKTPAANPTPLTWEQTTQAHFETSTLVGIDAVSKPGDLVLTGGITRMTAPSSDDHSILLMHFDEESGQPADTGGNRHQATNHGATAVEGRFGKALLFDGEDDYVALAGNDIAIDSGSATWAFWIKTTHTGSRNAGIVGGNNINGQTAAFVDREGYAEMTFNDSAGNSSFVKSTTVVNDGKWHHIAVARNEADFRMYVDGVYNAKGETGRSAGADGDIDHPGWYPMTIGRDLWYEGFFTGAIDELRISNVARTAFFESTPVATGSIVSPRITFERERIAEVRLDWVDTVPAEASITCYASNDAGNTWHKLAGKNHPFTFPSSNAGGDDLRIKAELKRGSGRTGPTLHSWKATYSLVATAAED